MISHFRILFGLYLTWHFASLISWSQEIFGLNGLINDTSLNPTYGIFPNILNHIEPILFVSFLTCIAILFTLGIKHNICSLMLWYGWTSLLNRNVLITNPGIPYIGFLLLAFTLIKNKDNSKLNIRIQHMTWVLICLGYTLSGLHKLQAPSWFHGQALTHILTSPIARDNLLTQYLLANQILLEYGTKASLILEILSLPFGLFARTKYIIWTSLLLMNIGVLCMVNFTDLTLGVLMAHLFIIF
jgi:hypothetical protein